MVGTVVAAAAALAGTSSATAAASGSGAAGVPGATRPAVQGAGLLPTGRPAAAGLGARPVLFDCQKPDAGLRPCFGPDQVRAAYGIQPLLDKGVTGAGRTIVVIDPYDPPNVQQELDTYTAKWQLPRADFRVVNPFGAGYDESLEIPQEYGATIALTVESLHVVAPAAKIVLLPLRSDSFSDFAAGVRYAVDHDLGDVVVQDLGDDEKCVGTALRARFHAAYDAGTRKGMTFLAASGNTGAATLCNNQHDRFTQAVRYPASDPLVLSVGGTRLDADPTTGAYHSETAWSYQDHEQTASGGGYSSIYPKPDYQQGTVAGTRRGVPDVAFDASAFSGPLLYSDPMPSRKGDEGFLAGHGTEVGAAHWAGLVALADQAAGHRLGAVNGALYQAGRGSSAGSLFHDETGGDNSYDARDWMGNLVETFFGYPARPGWDPVTGLGTPRANTLLPALTSSR